MDEAELKALADSARRAAVMAVICVAVAVLVLFIDNGIKRHVVSKANEARAILEEFTIAARAHGEQAAGQGGSGGSGGGDGGVVAGDGVEHDAGAGADVGPAADGVGAAPVRRPARVARGQGGDG